MITLTAIFTLITVGVSLMAESRPDLQQKLVMNPYSIYRHKQYYRFLTSGFVHSGWMHLLFNMMTFYSFGRMVEMRMVQTFGLPGWAYFAVLYLLGIVVSDIPTYLKYKTAPYYNSLGASGGVSSVIFAAILYAPLMEVCVFPPICFPGIVMGIVYLIFSYYFSKMGSNDNINHSAHLYGALFGFVFCVVIQPGALLDFIAQVQLAIRAFSR